MFLPRDYSRMQPLQPITKKSEYSRIIRGFSRFGAFPMEVIRLQRGGANKRPFYHLVGADSRRAASGKFLERLGFYDPKAPQGREAVRINLERVEHRQGGAAKIVVTETRHVWKVCEKDG